ncbi:MAG: DUF1697 domain-containing protein [Anaerolineaceae bacterium]
MQYGAFLRAINVGKHNRVKMEDLRALCVTLSFTNVSTYLQTGNIAFEWNDPEETAAVRLEEALIGIGLRNVPVIVRTREELLKLVKFDPFTEHDPAHFGRLVTLFRTPLPLGAEILLPPGSFQLVETRDREVLTVVELGRSGSLDLNGFLERKLHAQATTRKWNVVSGFVAGMPRGE